MKIILNKVKFALDFTIEIFRDNVFWVKLLIIQFTKMILFQPNNNPNPNNKITKTVELRLNNRWDPHHHHHQWNHTTTTTHPHHYKNSKLLDNVCIQYTHFTFSVCSIWNGICGMHYVHFAIKNYYIELLKWTTF